MNKTTGIRFSYNGEECVAYFKENELVKVLIGSVIYAKFNKGGGLWNIEDECTRLPKSYADIAYAHYRNQPTETKVQEPERLTDNLKQGGI